MPHALVARYNAAGVKAFAFHMPEGMLARNEWAGRPRRKQTLIQIKATATSATIAFRRAGVPLLRHAHTLVASVTKKMGQNWDNGSAGVRSKADENR